MRVKDEQKTSRMTTKLKYVGALLLSGQNCSPASICKKMITHIQFQLSRNVIIIIIIIIIELF